MILGVTAYHLLVIAMGFLMFYPVLWLIASSFKDNAGILIDSYKLLPKVFRPENYVNGWRGFGGTTFATFFKNSFIVASFATFGTTISSAFVAYGFSRLRFPGKRAWFICMMGTLMLPAQIILIPQYIIFQKIHWVNTFLPLIVPSFCSSAFFVFLIMQFIQGLPAELDEAAAIDGCSKYGTFFRIILPLIQPALISTIIIQFYWKWDEFLGPLLYLSRPALYTASIAIKAFADTSSSTDYGAMFAMSTLSLIPIFVIFLFFNRYLVQGISTSGLKG